MNNLETPLNSGMFLRLAFPLGLLLGYSLNDYQFSTTANDSLSVISIAAFKKACLNLDLSSFKYKSPVAPTVTFNETINFKNSKFQSKFSKGANSTEILTSLYLNGFVFLLLTV